MTEEKIEYFPPDPVKESEYDYVKHFGLKQAVNGVWIQLLVSGEKKNEIWKEFFDEYKRYGEWCDHFAPDSVCSDEEARANEKVFHNERIKMAWLICLIEKAGEGAKKLEGKRRQRRALRKKRSSLKLKGSVSVRKLRK